MNISEVRENYRKMPEHDIRHLALYEARDLTQEGVDALQSELRDRGFSTDFLAAIDIQLSEFSVTKHADLLEWLRCSPCPRCGSHKHRLNAICTESVSSFIFITNRSEKIVVGCPECLIRAHKKALIRSMLFGWWSIPWGPIETLTTLGEYSERRQLATSVDPTDVLIAYLNVNLGRLQVQRIRHANPFEDPD